MTDRGIALRCDFAFYNPSTTTWSPSLCTREAGCCRRSPYRDDVRLYVFVGRGVARNPTCSRRFNIIFADRISVCHPERSRSFVRRGTSRAKPMRSIGIYERDSKILFEIPTLCVALRVRLAIKLLAQDDAQNIKLTYNTKL